MMSSPPVTVSPGDSVLTALELFLDERVGSVIVVDRGVCGILTRTDVLAFVREAEAALEDDTVCEVTSLEGDMICEVTSLEDVPVCEVMSTDVVMTTGTTSLTTALRTMKAEGIRRLPVRQGSKPVGIVTLTDVAHHLPDQLEAVRSAVRQKDRRLE